VLLFSFLQVYLQAAVTFFHPLITVIPNYHFSLSLSLWLFEASSKSENVSEKDVTISVITEFPINKLLLEASLLISVVPIVLSEARRLFKLAATPPKKRKKKYHGLFRAR